MLELKVVDAEDEAETDADAGTEADAETEAEADAGTEAVADEETEDAFELFLDLVTLDILFFWLSLTRCFFLVKKIGKQQQFFLKKS